MFQPAVRHLEDWQGEEVARMHRHLQRHALAQRLAGVRRN
jgi:hypothetical protein